MDIKINFILSEAYYMEVYDEMVKYRLKYRKWQPIVALLNFTISGGVLTYIIQHLALNQFVLIPILFFLFGMHELYDYFNARKKWLKDRDKRLYGKTLNFRFTEEKIYHTGPYSKGEISWEGIQKVEVTKKGLFLIPEKGVSMYLPKRVFENVKDINLILYKLEAN